MNDFILKELVKDTFYDFSAVKTDSKMQKYQRKI
jgi:hypothetical protein